ncbi:helix-turn-helix domain-containing protein [Streptomyces sp. NRRL WC-3742]|uniref:helix-turn-helix domain-containing protein n=1 Tax=Streptomyces sp. NRRL WC-3742 TaxID=1463934 RepID=UPI0004C8DD2E|nr:helix-turn-helix domain-containing protein [Streptomyces sp. NRRL WC-3742]
MSAQQGKERFERWRDLIGRTRAAETTSEHVDDFTAQVRRLDLGPLVLLGSSFPSARFRRTKRLIQRSDQELYHLTLLTSGVHGLRRGRDQAETFGAGDLALIDSSTPHDVHLSGEQDPGGGRSEVAAVGLDLPASLLPVPPHRLRDLLGRRLSGREGTGALLAEFLLGLDRQGAGLRPAEAGRLGAVVVDLVAALVAGELDAECALPEDARQRTLVEGVRVFIRGNLHDPGLTPPVVAAAHNISVSHLHRLFARHFPGETVAGFIRAQRMRKAHRELADPGLRDLTIRAVGVRCGMPNPSDFGRAFKAAHGLTPREHRLLADAKATA